jgi:dephospho-CoA kinase
LKALIVGLTGGIVSGKTTVADMFRELGADIIDADIIAREVVRPKEKAWEKIVKHFGVGILRENQEINRKKLGNIVFSDKNKLKLLNQITHPEITELIKKKLENIINNNNRNNVCIVDVPLLFETGFENMMNKIIVVYLDPKKQINRLMKRNNLTREDALKRIKTQIPIEEKVKMADYIIDNSNSLEYTKKQVLHLWEELNKNFK